MRILFLSKDGDGIGVAHKLKMEGNDVRLFIQSKQFPLTAMGMVERVPSFRPHIPWADLIICDMVGFGKYEDLFRRMGKVVFGCSKIADLLELDRGKGIELFERVGISIPETYSFKGKEEAKQIADIWEAPGFVIKPSGNLDTASTHVCKDPELYLWALDKLPANTPLIVQKIEEGIEVSTEGWFNGRDWITPFNHTFEEKRFMDGDRGPNTGCMGNVVVTSMGDKLINSTIKKVTPFLKKISYRGPIDINCIVNEESAFALEFTARLGYDAIEALIEGLKEPVTDLFFETAIGVKKEMDITNDYMIAVRVSIPPFPHDDPEKEDAGLPILGINEHNHKHIFFTDIYMDREGAHRYAAGDGVLMKVTARGREVKEAQNRVYRTIENLTILDAQYRRDIGDRVRSDIKQLQAWGWLR